MSCGSGCGDCSSGCGSNAEQMSQWVLRLKGEGTTEERLKQIEEAINFLSVQVPQLYLEKLRPEQQTLFEVKGE